jgi:catechol 2,3-dioxygenase-like lactoylglutathione lyase family enzyme
VLADPGGVTRLGEYEREDCRLQFVDATIAIYQRGLGPRPVRFGGGGGRFAFGWHKLSLHQDGGEPKAAQPTPGSADLCLISAIPLVEVPSHLEWCGVALAAGSIARSGALGRTCSASFRDPNGNLVEAHDRP